VNLSATHLNLASALEWTNFNLLSGGSSDAALAAYETGLDSADELNTSATVYLQRRLLQNEVVEYLQEVRLLLMRRNCSAAVGRRANPCCSLPKSR
jgi:hypothetical protein